MKLHRIVVATAGTVVFALGGFVNAETEASAANQTPSHDAAAAAGEAQSQAAPADGVVIIQIQKKLASEGYDPGTADGVWGPQTEAAVRNFQRDQDMDATGQLDQETIAVLLVPVESGSEEAAGGQGAQGAETGAADQQTQGGSSADEGAPAQSPSQSQPQTQDRQ